MRRLIFSFLFAAVALTTAANSQTRPDFNRRQTFDALNYEIHVKFNRSAKQVIGDTRVTLTPLRPGFRSFELDAVGLKFSGVYLGDSDTKLKYTAGPQKVVISLDKAYVPGDVIKVRFVYTATAPKKGVYFVDALETDSKLKHDAQIWTQGEADESRHWFPNFDFPSDKATTEEFITAKKGETVIGNGILIGKDNTADGEVEWHYKMPIPHSTYLVSFVIGNYAKVEDNFGSIPLAFYTYPGTERIAKRAYRDTAKMIGVYEELTGVKFPYNKYDQTIVANFQFGGMENITATTMADTEILATRLDDEGGAGSFRDFGMGDPTDLVSHELAHSWFGDLVTCKNWAELWLNESFATYMEAAYREKVFGHEGYIRKLKLDAFQFRIDDVSTRRRHGLFNQRAGDIAKLFDVSAVTYNKGSVVLHMLREQVGDAAFWKAVNSYLNDHKFGNVESGDLRSAMEKASGQDLKWFFDQWVYGTGQPMIKVDRVYSAAAKKLTVTVTQTQSPLKATPAVYKFPLEIAITADGKVRIEKLDVTKKIQAFQFSDVGTDPKVQIDPYDKQILVWSIEKAA